MSKNPTIAYKPDISFTVHFETKTGQLRVESANGVPLNPLFLASVCMSIAKFNVDSAISAQVEAATNKNKGAHPHQFLALEGEHRCRVPGCGKIRNDAIHVTIPSEPTAVQ